ncbi:MAG TPA: hypothetical protein VHZ55_20800 [Bryobacteraceae bacterium]|jgi:hypothetical protein|nr:hypothetical protein [Bryobacteraceae bacterium]
MLNKFVMTCLAAGAAVAFAASGTYKVDILDNTIVEGKQVKAGSYKIEIENNMAVLKHGKESIQVPAHTEQSTSKFSGTQIQYVDNAMHEIRLGGTNTKIVFGNAGGAPTGGSN